MRVTSTHDYLLFFTNRGRVYWLRVYDIPSMQRTSRGRALANILTMPSNEWHMAILKVSEFEEDFVFFATEKGIVKKTPLSAFSRPRPSGIQAITLDADDALIKVSLSGGDDEIVLGTRGGMACRFKEADVRAMGRSARGVRGIHLKPGDVVVDLAIMKPDRSLLTVCENGYGKRTDIDAYRLTRRGGKGVINIKTTKRNGPVVALRPVTDDDALMLITSNGILLKMALDQLREIGRATQGVRLIRVEEDDRVVAVARVPSDKEERELDGIEGEADQPTDQDAPGEPSPPSEPEQATEPDSEETGEQS